MLKKNMENKAQKVPFIRDKHVDVMLFWGIVFVVMGHNYQLPNFFFPAYTFHMAFFFFISGYLFKIKIKLEEKINFIKHKIITQLGTYFLLNSIFFLMAYILRFYEINLTNDFSLYNFFIEPFISGHQNSFIIPSWFLLNLFIVNVIMQLFYIKEANTYKIKVLFFIIIIAIIGVYYGLNKYTDFRLLLVRTSFAMLFFQIGIIIRTYKTIIDKYLFNPNTIIILYILVTLLTNFFGNIAYSIVWGSVENKYFFVPLLTTLFIILISYSITYHLSRIVTDNSFILKIGQNSFYIMAIHLCIFFCINVLFYLLGVVEKDVLNNIYYNYNVSHTFLVYQISAILIPILIGINIKKWK